MRIFGKAHYQFIEARKKAYVVSGIVVAIGVAAMIFNIVSMGTWQNYGVDFTGGSLVQVRFEGEMTAATLRDALGGADAPPITQFGRENEFIIRAPLAEDASIDDVAAAIEASPHWPFCSRSSSRCSTSPSASSGASDWPPSSPRFTTCSSRWASWPSSAWRSRCPRLRPS
jgi:hypothetical protein